MKFPVKFKDKISKIARYTALMSLAFAQQIYGVAASQDGFVIMPSVFGFLKPHIAAGGGGGTYINSIQQISIAVNSVSSNTASVSAPTGKYFIVDQHFNSDSTSNASTGMHRIELTSNTVITASRTTAGSTSATVNCVLVDATSSLITSIQSGTIALTSAQTSNTASVSAVTNTNTVCHFLGMTSSNSGVTNRGDIYITVSLTTTTVTATRSIATQAAVVGFIIIEFNGSALQSSTQQFNKSWTNSSTTTTQALTSVVANNSMAFYGGANMPSSAHANSLQYGQITNGTTFTITTNSTNSEALKYQFTIVEFKSGVLNSAVQRGTIALAAAASNTATITSVNVNRSIYNFNYSTSSSSSITGGLGVSQYNLTQTSATVVTLTAINAQTGTGAYEVAEFT